jgi:hypothetical protein
MSFAADFVKFNHSSQFKAAFCGFESYSTFLCFHLHAPKLNGEIDLSQAVEKLVSHEKEARHELYLSIRVELKYLAHLGNATATST